MQFIDFEGSSENSDNEVNYNSIAIDEEFAIPLFRGEVEFIDEVDNFDDDVNMDVSLPGMHSVR